MQFDVIRETLNRLLEIPDGGPMPNRSGVCLELGMAVTDASLPYTVRLNLTMDTPEYEWCDDLATEFNRGQSGYVDVSAVMTPRRREFIHFLLSKLPEVPQ